jgi:hypothetical protein
LVHPREAWTDEAANFTPWLAEEANLSLLGETLGITLELGSSEKQVGSFKADILARDTLNQRWVVIENQLASTDHAHLGQLLTYAAGLEAHSIIWIASGFREEHRAAIDFLNQATTEEYAFFGIQIELYRIGTSALAPRFTIVAKPNNWNKQGQLAKSIAEGRLDDTQRLNFEYWSALIAAANFRYPALAGRRPYKTGWQNLEALCTGDPRVTLQAGFSSDNGLRVEAYIDGSKAKLAFAELHSRKADIEASFGDTLFWEDIPENRGARISCTMPGNERRQNRDRWAAQHDWILTRGRKIAEALRPFMPALNSILDQKNIEN